MKHTFKLTLLILFLFILAQVTGLFIVSQYVDIQTTSTTGNTTINSEKYLIEPPKVQNESNSWILLLIPILLGTGLILLIIKFKLFAIWKIWFFLSITIALFIAIHPFTSLVYDSFIISGILAFILGYAKTKHPNIWVHNGTEILLYGGIAALFVPILNITSGIIMLILISIYDIIAVWFSKHMVAMAKFQTSENAFAGIHIPGKVSKTIVEKTKKSAKTNTKKTTESSSGAILGGGDIAFPLLFAGIILKTTGNFGLASLISIGALCGLAYLFMMSKKDKFYPAMPFISAGCFIAFGIIQLF